MAELSESRKAVDVMAEQFRVARARRQWSQEEVAKRAGVDPARVSQIENGRRDPRFSTVVRIAGALGLQVLIGDAA